MESAHVNLPVADWPAAPKANRSPMRIYVPGEECLAKLVSGTLPPLPGAVTTTTVPPVTLPPDPNAPPTTPPRAVVVQITSGTAVPENVLDPRAPMPSVDLRTYVYPCQRPPANVVVQKKK
jgi:hypothetical protein